MICKSVWLCICLLVVWIALPALAWAQAVDPDIMDSEFNHHLAGYVLVVVAVLMLAAEQSPKLKVVHAVWPFLLMAAGVFLAVWSDKEIWPRGFLSWTWLIHHDAEARQHKIYALLLTLLGVVEYSRWRQKLPRFWHTWAFPALATFGAVLLLFHTHGGSSGLPAGWEQMSATQTEALIAVASQGEVPPVRVDNAVNAPTPNHKIDPQVKPEEPRKANMGDMADMPGMDRQAHQADSVTEMGDGDSHVIHKEGRGSHKHAMTPSMLHVQEQHLWFTLVGLVVALFKFTSDAGFRWKRTMLYLWPGAMAVLGVLLVAYSE